MGFIKCNDMPKFYFTCGQSHCHVVGGKTWDKGSILEVNSVDYDAAREFVFDQFGDKWSFQYEEDELEGILPFFRNGIVTTITEKPNGTHHPI